MRKIAFFLALLLCPTLANAETADYGEKVEVLPGATAQFADFDLLYLGTRPGALFPGSETRRMGDCYAYLVTTHQKTKSEICWTSGTGDIGPAVFEAGKHCFWLERVESKIGKLAPNEIVITEDVDSPTACAARKN